MGLIGQISASLSAMHRTVDDYDSMAKREIIKAKQEKAQMLVLLFDVQWRSIDLCVGQAGTKIQNRLCRTQKPVRGIKERSRCPSAFLLLLLLIS